MHMLATGLALFCSMIRESPLHDWVQNWWWCSTDYGYKLCIYPQLRLNGTLFAVQCFIMHTDLPQNHTLYLRLTQPANTV